MMIQNIKKVSNPLTIIAIFAGIAEVSGTVVLPFINDSNQPIFMWFVMIFPILLVVLFFITLWAKHTVLYAPSDYKDETNFISLSNRKNTEYAEMSSSSVIETLNDLKKRLGDTGSVTIDDETLEDLAHNVNINRDKKMASHAREIITGLLKNNGPMTYEDISNILTNKGFGFNSKGDKVAFAELQKMASEGIVNNPFTIETDPDGDTGWGIVTSETFRLLKPKKK